MVIISFYKLRAAVAVMMVVMILQSSLGATGEPKVKCYGAVYLDKDVDYGAAVDQALADMVESTTVAGVDHHVQRPSEDPVVFGHSRCAKDDCATTLDSARDYLRFHCPHRIGAYVDMGGGTYMGYYNRDY